MPTQPEPGPNQSEVNRRQGVVNAKQGDVNAEVVEQQRRNLSPDVEAALSEVTKAAGKLRTLVVDTRRSSRFYTAALAVVVALTIVLLIRTVHDADSRNHTNVANQQKVVADLRKAKISAHIQCLRGNDGRVRIRKFNADTWSIVVDYTRTTPTAGLAAALQRIADRGAQILPTQNCDQVAPLPLNMTGAELAQIPTPEPIPPLGP